MTINRNEYYVRPVNGDDSSGDGLSHATAWKTTAHALSTISIDTTDGDRINICDEGTETLSNYLPFTTYGQHSSKNAGLILEGYTSTIGDGGIFSINCGGYGVTGNLSAYDYISFINGKVTNWAFSVWCFQLDDVNTFINMEIDGTRSGNNSYKVISCGSYCEMRDCKIHNLYSTSGISVSFGSGSHVVNNYIEAPANPSLRLYNAAYCTGNVIINSRYGAVSEIIELRNGYTTSIANNTLVHTGGGTGQAIGLYHTGVGYSTIIRIYNNYIEGYSGVGAKGIYLTTDTGNNYVSNNYFYNCTTAEEFEGEVVYEGKGPTILSSPGLVKVSFDDYRPRFALTGKSQTGDFVPAGAKSARDIGALQRNRGVGSRATSLQAGRVR